MDFTNLIKHWKPCTGRIVFTFLGFASAVSFLTLGFGKTMVILICCGAGYCIGAAHDKNISLTDIIKILRGVNFDVGFKGKRYR